MSKDFRRSTDPQSTRRHFLAGAAFSLSPLALAWLRQSETNAETTAKQGLEKPPLEKEVFDVTPKSPPNPPRASAMISLWMQGGPSHIDLFDPKPALAKLDGKAFPGKIKYDNAAQASSKVFASPWKFRQHGECGAEISELAPCLAEVVDDLTILRSTRTGVNNHGQSIRALNTGRTLAGRPALGSWLTYALGAETDNLPAYVALNDPGQLPVLGVENWSQGFLPSIYQGTPLGTMSKPVSRAKIPNLDRTHISQSEQRQQLDLIQQLNRNLKKKRGDDSAIDD